jgi:UDP-N-acetylmuramoyl-L-alanyl-D-glutamate--2,6-diaminopimelate ligase
LRKPADAGTTSDFSLCHRGEKHKCHTNLAENTILLTPLWLQLLPELQERLACGISGLGSLKNVPGRLEAINNDRGINVIVDYAHSPAALENVLKALRPITRKRLIVVFGCGGNRSHEKRPVMGQVAFNNADVIVVTSDNPRKETPEAIIEQIMNGIKQLPENSEKTVLQETDRKLAIHKALNMAEAGDTVIIAGKGHETGQYFADRTVPFDDREVARNFFRKPEND